MNVENVQGQPAPQTPFRYITTVPLHSGDTAYISHTYTSLKDLKYIHLSMKNKKKLLRTRSIISRSQSYSLRQGEQLVDYLWI